MLTIFQGYFNTNDFLWVLHSLQSLRILLLPKFDKERKELFQNENSLLWKAIKECFIKVFDKTNKKLKEEKRKIKNDEKNFKENANEEYL